MSKAKLSRISNKGLIESALKQIEEETGFHITDIEFGNYYFLFDGPKNSICHFHIKEIPKFKFALWNTNRFDSIEEELKNGDALWSDYYGISSKSELVFFTQFERDIDKFKPSYSGFVNGIFRQAWYEKDENDKRIKKEEWDLFYLTDILEFMHKHPIKSYIYVGMCNNHIWNEVSGLYALKRYIHDAIYHRKSEIKKWFKINHNINACKRLARKLKTMDYIIEKKDCCYPEVEIRLTNSTNEGKDFEKDVIKIDRFSDKYFNNISVSTYYDYFDEYSDESKEKVDKNNKDLHKRFYRYAKSLKKILDGNSKETLEDHWVEKVVDMKISEEVK